MLPTATGFNEHDPTRSRWPAFSLGLRTIDLSLGKTVGPGPGAYDIREYTRYGHAKARSAPLSHKIEPLTPVKVPGSNAYLPNDYASTPLPPAFSFGLKGGKINKYKKSPGPNQYLIPTCIGPNVPDKEAAGAFSVLSRNVFHPKDYSPGPGKYKLPEIHIYKDDVPQFSIKNRHITTKDPKIPGPKYYPSYNTKIEPPKFSFGVKQSDDLREYYTPEDLESIMLLWFLNKIVYVIFL